jgi:(2Fe-2S) ferredoxin
MPAEDVSQGTHRVLVCQGRLCQARGSLDIRRQWARRAEPGTVVIGTACLGLCPVGPVAVVYPEGIWLGRQRSGDVVPAVKALKTGRDWPGLLTGPLWDPGAACEGDSVVPPAADPLGTGPVVGEGGEVGRDPHEPGLV